MGEWYEVHVAGLVPVDELRDDLGPSGWVVHQQGTVLTVRCPDQASLHGFLHRLRELDVEVVEVRPTA